MSKPVMLTMDQIRKWVHHGGGACPFCQSEQVKYQSTMRALNALTTVTYFCHSCRKAHHAIYTGDTLVDLTHDSVKFDQEE